MGLILAFTPAGRKPLARRIPEIPRDGADILFFTGVRYGWRNHNSKGDPSNGNDGGAPTRGADGRPSRSRRRKAIRG